MTRRQNKWIPAAVLFLTFYGSAGPQARTYRIPWNRVLGANPAKLSSKDRDRAVKLMQRIHCYYGCSNTVARCLTRDPKCQTARRIAGMIVRMVAHGRSDRVIRREVMLRSKSMHPFKKYKFRHHRRHCTANPAKAKVVITAFSEFQCPFCSIVLPTLSKIVPRFGSRVVLCYKHFPTTSHGTHAVLSSCAAVAAGIQGKFWPMHDILYRNRRRQSARQIAEYARRLHLDMAKFRKDWVARSTLRLVVLDKRQGLKARVMGTPTLFVNGKHYYGRKDSAELVDRMAEELHLAAGGR